MWNLKCETSELIYETKIDSQTQKKKKKLMVTKGEKRVRNKLGINRLHTTIYKIDKQPGPTVWHRALYSLSCNNL